MSRQLSLFDQTGPGSYGFVRDENLNLIFSTAFPVLEAQLVFEPPLSMMKRPQVLSSRDAASILKRAWSKGKIGLQEHFYMMMLSRSQTVLGVAQIGVGGMHYAPVDLKIIFAAALKACSSALVFAHNHPSGNLEPSEADIAVTKKLTAAAQILDLQVADHLILSPWGYLSMADEGIMPEVGTFPSQIEMLNPAP